MTKAIAIVCSAYVRKHAAEVMNRLGADVAAFGYLKDAVEYLKSHRVDLVVLDPDCCNPGVRESIQIIRSISTETAIAVLIGWWDQRGVDLDKEHVCILSRPIRPEEIEELLKHIPSGRQVLYTW
jgi:DNA-binding NtrC family response regulator